MGNPISGVGTIFRRWDTTTGAWVNLGNITNIDGPNKSKSSIDTTALDTAGGYRTKIGGFRDPGQVVLTLNFTREAYDILNDDFELDINQNYEIVWADTDTTSEEFEGFVSAVGRTTTVDDVVTFNVTIDISGQTQTESGSGS